VKGGVLGHELDLLYDSHIRDDSTNRASTTSESADFPRAADASA
jgi:hypothetical protein